MMIGRMAGSLAWIYWDLNHAVLFFSFLLFCSYEQEKADIPSKFYVFESRISLFVNTILLCMTSVGSIRLHKSGINFTHFVSSKYDSLKLRLRTFHNTIS